MAAFGFSVGDFVTFGNMIQTVVSALQKSRGAASDYQSLVHSLVSLNCSIRTCSTHFLDRSFDPGDPACRNEDASTVNALVYEVEHCKVLLENFMSAQQKYAESLLPGRRRKLFRDEWRMVKWFVYKTEDVAKLQRDLRTHIEAIQMYTLVLIGESTSRLEKALDHNATSTQLIHGRVTEMLGHVRIMAENIPKYVAPWEGGFLPSERPLQFEDVLGRSFPMPLMFCSNPETFHDVLTIMFKRLPGQEQVSRRQYELLDISEHSIMEESVWHEKVKPGSTVKMSVMLPLASARRAQTRSCPRCGKNNNLHENDQRMVKCFFCHLYYEVIEKERIVEVVEPTKPRVRSGSDDNTWKAGQVKRPTNTRRTSSGEKVQRKFSRPEDPFKRISYVNEKISLQHKMSRDPSIKLRNPFKGTGSSTDLLVDIVEMGDADAVVGIAEMGDIDAVRKWLQDGGSPDVTDDEGKPLLHAAARSGNESLVRLLIQHDADVNIQGGYWHSALQAAAGMAQASSAPIVKLLLENNADPHALGGHYGDALQAAAAFCGQHGNDEAVQLLLEYGAEVNVKGGTYGSPLQALAFKGEAEMIELLLQHDVDVNVRSGPWDTALQAAAATAYVGGEEAVRVLLENGADVNARGGHFETALHAAANTNKEGIVKLLLENGADINARGEDGATALHQAADEGNAGVVRVLLAAGADLDIKNKWDFTAAEVAAKHGRHDVVQLLQT